MTSMVKFDEGGITLAYLVTVMLQYIFHVN